MSYREMVKLDQGKTSILMNICIKVHICVCFSILFFARPFTYCFDAYLQRKCHMFLLHRGKLI